MTRTTADVKIADGGLVMYVRTFNSALQAIRSAIPGVELTSAFNKSRYDNPQGFCSITLTQHGVPGSVRVVGVAEKIFVTARSVRGRTLYTRTITWPIEVNDILPCVTAITSSVKAALRTMESALATASACADGSTAPSLQEIAELTGGVACHAGQVTAGEDAKNFAREFLRTSMGKEQSYLPSYYARIEIAKAILAVAPEFDGKSGVYKRFAAALEKAVTPGLVKHEYRVNVETFKSSSGTTVSVRVLDNSGKSVETYDIDGDKLSPVKSDKLCAAAQNMLTMGRERVNAILQAAGNIDKAREAAERLYDAVKELAEASKSTPRDIIHRLSQVNF